MLSVEKIQNFKANLRGELIGPDDPGYEMARKVYNAMIDRHPQLIAKCVDVADVIASVNFGRENQLLISIRGGGHNVAGFAVCDDGLVIDLSRMKGIHVDPANRTLRVEAGCTWGDVDHATHPFGLAVPGGVISTTGVAGLTLGGGIGHLTRKYGLSCDSMISADVVLANGNLVTAYASQNDDLFWALRGGGGNFGVVTSFKFKLHPVSIIVGGPVLWTLDKARDAMRFYRDYMAKAPEDLNAFFAFLKVPPGPPFPENLHNKNACGMVICYTGSADHAESVIGPIQKFGPPAFQMVGPMPFPVIQSIFDPLVPPGLQNYWKADFINDLSDELIEGHLKYGPDVPTVNTAVHIYPVSGAAHRVKKNETAFAYRDANYVHVLAAIYPDSADSPKNIEWVRQYFNELHPHSAGGAYVNFMMEEGDERIASTYAENYKRLVEVKRKYDPNNLFRVNQNIKP